MLLINKCVVRQDLWIWDNDGMIQRCLVFLNVLCPSLSASPWPRGHLGGIWNGNKWKSISWTRKHHLPMIPMYQFIQKHQGLFSGKSLQGLFCALLANCWDGLPLEHQNGGVNRGIIYIYLMILCHPWKIRESHLRDHHPGMEDNIPTRNGWDEMRWNLS